MGKKRGAKVRNYRDVERYTRDCPSRNCGGSHVVKTLPNGRKLTVYRNHGGDYPKGTRRMIEKALAAAGLFILAFSFTLIFLMEIM